MNNRFTELTSNMTPHNLSQVQMTEEDEVEEDYDYLYDRADVRAICIFFYSIVFIACFFGNLIVILVVTIHWRMRSITNFCLANLAFADFCVSLFCVYQNMYIYFMSSWVFGAFLCKMYYFITELSHTASILILVVICIERYLAIVHPMRCKEWLTITRLRLTIIGVWSTSAIYSAPRLYFTNIRRMPLHEGGVEVLCIPIRTLYDSRTFDMTSFAILFVLPLLVISILYTRIAWALWQSSKNQMQSTSSMYVPAPSSTGAHESCSLSDDDQIGDPSGIGDSTAKPSTHSCVEILCCGYDPCGIRFSPSPRRRHHSMYHKEPVLVTSPNTNGINSLDSIVVYKFEKKSKSFRRKYNQPCRVSLNKSRAALLSGNNLSKHMSRKYSTKPKRISIALTGGGKNGSRALESRRRIIKMLVVIVFAFAMCNLPFHARKIWQYYGTGYSGGSTFSSIFTPLTFLIMYANSGINPILYAFMSKKFRICFMDLLTCKMKRSFYVTRNASVRSTHIIHPPSP